MLLHHLTIIASLHLSISIYLHPSLPISPSRAVCDTLLSSSSSSALLDLEYLSFTDNQTGEELHSIDHRRGEIMVSVAVRFRSNDGYGDGMEIVPGAPENLRLIDNIILR